jgi:plasmid stability protein
VPWNRISQRHQDLYAAEQRIRGASRHVVSVADQVRRIAELETSNAESKAAVIVAGRELRKLNFGRQDSPVLKLLRRTLRDARQVAKTSAKETSC